MRVRAVPPTVGDMDELVPTVAGEGLGAVIAGIRRLRHPRPVHPRGLVLTGELEWMPQRSPAGVDWIDGPHGEQPVLARLSRSIGLPPSLPDVLGLALRIGPAEAFGDLLLASTGLGVPSRFALTPHFTPAGARFGSIMPYRGDLGPVFIATRTLTAPALPASPAEQAKALDGDVWVLQLMHASPASRWHPFATLTLSRDGESGIDTDVRFDPVLHPLPGTTISTWARRVREPGYAEAQQRPSATPEI